LPALTIKPSFKEPHPLLKREVGVFGATMMGLGSVIGTGVFVSIGGLPAPEFLAYFVAVFEITCGSLVALGLLTRLAVIPTITIMLVAIASTKVPILLSDGFWKMAHEARTDWSMLLGTPAWLTCRRALWDSFRAEHIHIFRRRKDCATTF
jgi:hypothetical protein